ncbi:MAG: PAS domain-containing protein [Steroidobacteraceae bacterium]
MPPKTLPFDDLDSLRSRAVSHLRSERSNANSFAGAPDALGVLYDLSSSPATAPKALALLHELQVHQVELDLQHEELRRSRAELEVSLARQNRLYDAAPVAYLTIDPDTTLREVNLTAERVLGQARDSLLGRALESFLLPQAHAVLQGLLAQLVQGSCTVSIGALRLAGLNGTPRLVQANVSRDPDGDRFLLVLTETNVT